MQKFPLRNQCKPNNNKAFGSSDIDIRMQQQQQQHERRDCSSPHKMPSPAPQRLQRICHPIASATSLEKRQLSMEKPVKVCNRVLTEEAAGGAENVATWNDVLSRASKQSKSLPSTLSSTQAEPEPEAEAMTMVEGRDIALVERREPPQRVASAEGKLEVPCNATAPSSNTNTSTKNNNKNNNNSVANGNRSKDDHDAAAAAADDDDDNNRRSRLQLQMALEQYEHGHGHHDKNHQSGTQAETAFVSAAASIPEYTTYEELRLGDQINFLLYDPYRTLKFLITELKSRLKTVVPDDINIQKILAEILQTIKRIRMLKKTSQPAEMQPEAATRRKTSDTAITTSAETISTVETVKYMLPKERCHVIKVDPLRSDARKVNSSCQTITSKFVNLNACQMCEHYQVNHQSTVGCNQNRINENNSNADDDVDGDGDVEVEMTHSTGAYEERSKDHRKDVEVRESFSCKSLQDAIDVLKIKNNPFSLDAQKIITQLETELSIFQRNLERISSYSSSELHGRPLAVESALENSKVHCKCGLGLLEDKKQEDETKSQEEQEQTCQDFMADKLQFKFSKHCNRPNSSSTNQATSVVAPAVPSYSKESQTNLRSPTQMFCHFEKEKLLLMQNLRKSEMQTIHRDLNELHVYINDQLNGIYQSITRENQNLKYFDQGAKKRPPPPPDDDVSKQKSLQKNFLTLQHRPEKTQVKGLPSILTSALLETSTPSSSSVFLSRQQQMHKEDISSMPREDLRSIWARHSKKSSSPILGDKRNANNIKQKSSSSLLSTADAKEHHHDISDKTVCGGKKSKHSPKPKQLYSEDHLSVNNCLAHCRFADTPFCSACKKYHFSNVDCRCQWCLSHFGARSQINDRVQRKMGARAAKTSTTKSAINSTKKTPSLGPAVMTHHERNHHSHSAIAQERIQLISPSLPRPAGAPVMTALPSYISTRTTDEASSDPDAVMNAAITAIKENAYAAAITCAASTATQAATAAPRASEHSNDIRGSSHQIRNSWQRVNLKNPTGCQLKKQICGSDGYESTIKNSNNNNNNYDNHSNYPEIHDCQKYRAKSINPFCGLDTTQMHDVGGDNGPPPFTAATVCDDFNYDEYNNDRGAGGEDNLGVDVRIGTAGACGDGGNGPPYLSGKNKSLPVEANFTCHPEKRHRHRHRHRQWRQQTPRLLQCCLAQSELKTDLKEFKKFLDETTPSTE